MERQIPRRRSPHLARRRWQLPELATRLAGSSDLYGPSGRQPHASINFVTAHDGFTLADLVSYNEKHNAANGEDNRDGESNNLSWNCGVEGPTTDRAILELRARQRRNLLLTLLVSQGVPMLSGGDELGRTQRGNNNAYCHDSDLSWTPWDMGTETREFLEFVRRVIALRASQPVLKRQTFLNGHRRSESDVLWLRPDGAEMTSTDWNDITRRAFGMLLDGDAILECDARGQRITGDTLLVLINTGELDVTFSLPVRDRYIWTLEIDTMVSSDTPLPSDAGKTVTLASRSMVVLLAKSTERRHSR